MRHHTNNLPIAIEHYEEEKPLASVPTSSAEVMHDAAVFHIDTLLCTTAGV